MQPFIPSGNERKHSRKRGNTKTFNHPECCQLFLVTRLVVLITCCEIFLWVNSGLQAQTRRAQYLWDLSKPHDLALRSFRQTESIYGTKGSRKPKACFSFAIMLLSCCYEMPYTELFYNHRHQLVDRLLHLS